ncbi:MAG TPA: 4-carboxy-4-hydroxy-2-oxoadipate aldolase/oxaloacetate decarboxylase [Alphaproteobacteria bacterium]|nr:4-carboxy-4-hydroxy-2-oxoadipate aldolase/oxaloacetate decarboxylase [Alphaproteobacteria bacterium]
MIPPVVYTKIPETDPALVAAAAEMGVADLHEALGAVEGRALLMSPRMRPLDPTLKMAGAAVTVFNYPGDNLMMHQALYLAGKGHVLVMTNGGAATSAQWGELAGVEAQTKGLAGLVVDGAVRDTQALIAMRFPVWATAIHASHPEKRGPGAVNIPVVVDGVLVHPGDIVVADGDGVLVIPPAYLRHAVDGARRRQDKEADMRRRILAGEHLHDLLGLQKAMDASGVEIRQTSWAEDRTKRSGS